METMEEAAATLVGKKSHSEQLDDTSTPETIDLEEYLSTVKAHRRRRQIPGQERFVLFILDTSGSIGATEFKKATDAVADLVPLLCNAKVAVMTYSTYVYREICYNCYQDSVIKLRNAIRSIKYRGGVTASGDAIRCACDYMLNSPCKFTRNIINPPKVDVIFLTDGRSNTGEDVCTATECLSTITNVDVFPISIGNNTDWLELDCIRGRNGNLLDVLSVVDLDALLNLIRDSIINLINDADYCIE